MGAQPDQAEPCRSCGNVPTPVKAAPLRPAALAPGNIAQRLSRA